MSFRSVKEITDNYEGFYVIDEAQTQLFRFTECEKCEKKVMGPNAVTLVKNPIFMNPLNTLLKNSGLKQVEKPMDELHWCDALGVATCSDCWIDDAVDTDSE